MADSPFGSWPHDHRSVPEDVTRRPSLAFDEDGLLRRVLAPSGQDVVVRGLVR
ncbi:hypothetical protein [Streptomyces sp. SGAir0957]